jgi:RNA polymerase sigma-70 factor (ECF subfamily)
MDDSPATRASLLMRIRNGADTEAWREFVELYAALIYGFARKRGLQDADAADLMQDVLRAVAASAGRLEYDPARGSFRSWLYTVTRNKLYNFLNGQRRHVRATGDSGVQKRLEEESSGSDDTALLWDREYERRLFSFAAERIRNEFREQTWRAFWHTAVDGQAAQQVAEALQMSPGAVYVAKSRVLARLRREIEELQAE